MLHNDHCFHCGQQLAAGTPECTNAECWIEANALPIWPYSRCHTDNAWAIVIMNNVQRFRMMWMPVLGIILFLFGNMFLSGRLINIGLVLIGGWFLSRYLLWLIRKEFNALYIRERSRDAMQNAFDHKQIQNDSENRKKLDDENDRARAKGWSVRGHQWLKMTANMATILLVISIILSWGPGNILPWNLKNFATETAKTIVENPTVIKAVKVTKKAMDWDNHKLTYVENTLRHKLDLTFEQFQVVTKNPDFKYEMVEASVDSGLRGDGLFNYLQEKLKKARPSISVPDNSAETKGFFAKMWSGIKSMPRAVVSSIGEYFQGMRQMQWLVLLWLNFLLFHFVGFALALGVVSFAAAKGFDAADEIKDILKEKFEEFKEGKEDEKESAGGETAKPTKPPASTEKRHGIIDIAIVSWITDIIFEKMFKRFNK